MSSFLPVRLTDQFKSDFRDLHIAPSSVRGMALEIQLAVAYRERRQLIYPVFSMAGIDQHSGLYAVEGEYRTTCGFPRGIHTQFLYVSKTSPVFLIRAFDFTTKFRPITADEMARLEEVTPVIHQPYASTNA